MTETMIRRTGHANWGPRLTVTYSPRWSSDHHPWKTNGPMPIRYANHEVTEDIPLAADATPGAREFLRDAIGYTEAEVANMADDDARAMAYGAGYSPEKPPRQSITVISYGAKHPGGHPGDEFTKYYVGDKFRDPHVDADFRYLDGTHPKVIAKVLSTPGVLEYLAPIIADAMKQIQAGNSVRIAFGCVGGRHRSVVMAWLVAKALGPDAVLIHRDISKDVIKR